MHNAYGTNRGGVAYYDRAAIVHDAIIIQTMNSRTIDSQTTCSIDGQLRIGID